MYYHAQVYGRHICISRTFSFTALVCTALAWAMLLPIGLRPALAAGGETVTMDLSSAAGIAWQFQPEGGDAKPLVVPGGGWRAQGYDCDAGTYRATISIPASARGQIVRVRFDAVNFGADISAGPDDAHLTKVASHVDGWVPVTADVTAEAIPGKPMRLVVEVKGRNKFKVNGKYTVPDGATWDPYLEDGILRGVHLQILPPVHVDDVFVRPDVAEKTLTAQVTVTNSLSKPAAVILAPELSSANASRFPYPKPLSVKATLAPGETRVIALPATAWDLGTKSLWWPNVPYQAGYRAQMHVLTVNLLLNGQVEHVSRQRFGFRQFRAVGNHYYLNGIRCNLRGDNQQEADFGTDAYGIRPGFGPPSPGNGGWPQAVDNLQRLNFNVMRIHQIPATPYMLDVCDAMGLMLVDESPLRGSEGHQDYEAGKENMLNMDRELVMRDRNHPAVVIWSAANEWATPIKDAVPAIQAIDDTRPIIADGVNGMDAPYINMEHYVSGFDKVPDTGGKPRTDRPYGETEDIWPHDNTLQGFAWMATGIRIRRLKGDADLRNYVLNNAWPNYVSGESPDNEVLELRIKGNPQAKILPAIADPWHNPNLLLIQKCYNPVTVCDLDFDQVNKDSNNQGDWPVALPLLEASSPVTRTLAVFNDEFSGESVDLAWQLHTGTQTGPLLKSGQVTLHIPLGEFATQDITFDAPAQPGTLVLTVTASKNGQVRFMDDLIGYAVAPAAAR